MAQNQPLVMDIGQGLSLMIGLPTIASWTGRERPKNARLGTFGFNSETNSLEYWNGSYWLGASLSEV